MISRVASSLAHTAALEYAQRRGPKIFKSAVDDPVSLRDPSVYITGKKSPATLPMYVNENLIRPVPNRPVVSSVPVNTLGGRRTRRYKSRSRKSRKSSR